MRRYRERDLAILNAIRQRPQTIGELVEATGIPRTPVQRRVQDLERRGLVHHNPDGTFSVPMAPESPSSLPGGIGGRPYSDADLRRDAIDHLLLRHTQEERLLKALQEIHKWEAEADERAEQGDREGARRLRAEAERWRRDLSAVYGVDLTRSGSPD